MGRKIVAGFRWVIHRNFSGQFGFYYIVAYLEIVEKLNSAPCLTCSHVHGKNPFINEAAFQNSCPDGGTGRRAGLKIRFFHESGSSTLPPGTS